MKFVVDRGGSLSRSTTPGPVKKAITVLDSLRAGKVMIARALSDAIGISHDRLAHYTTHPALSDYRFVAGHNEVYYGSKKTIVAARKQFHEA